MKCRVTISAVVVAVLMAASPAMLLAQNGPGKGPNGRGYGGPPQSEEERAARQAACLEKNGGVCPNGGPKANCPGYGAGKGQGNGAGKGWGKGPRNGTGPRAGNGTCPYGNQAAPTQK
jgi:hypothetical protein